MAASATAADERQEIIARYDAGPQHPGRSLEAPDPVYPANNLDHFGFYHRDGIPPDVLAAEERIKRADGRREAKWRKMLAPGNRSGGGSAARFAKWSKVATRSGESGELALTLKFVRRVYKGIPEKYRYPVWYELLSIDEARKQSPVSYPDVLTFARRRSPDVRQIDLDVNRTYRSTDYYRVRYNARQRVLFNVLVAYSVYNIDVGYCQGMSQLAAFLLLYFNDEEETFWAMSQLFTNRRHAMHGLFIPGFPKLYRCIEIYRRCLRRYLSRVDKHVHKKHGVPVTAYTVKWFMQVFLDCVPFSLAIRIWDVFIAVGEAVPIAMAFNLMRLHARHILRLKSDEALLHFFGQVLPTDHSVPEDDVLEGLHECLADMRAAGLLPLPARPPEAELPQTAFSFDRLEAQLADAAAIERRRASQDVRRPAVVSVTSSMVSATSDDANHHHHQQQQQQQQQQQPDRQDADNVDSNGLVVTAL